MSGYLQRMASSALSPGGSIRPILGSMFSRSTYRRTPEDIPGKGSVSSLIGPERAAPPAAAAPDSALEPGLSGSFNPLVNESQQRNVERPVVFSMEMSNGDARSDEPPNLAAQNKHEIVTLRQHAPGNQGAGLQPPLPTVTPISGNAKQTGSTEPISEPDALAARAQKNDVEKSEAPDKIRYHPLMTAGGSNADGPAALWRVSSPLTPSVRKEAKGNLSSSSGSPEREPDEIQIHIGRIEVTAVAQAMPRPVPPPVRKSISLDDYLKRGDGRSR
jgi:hypothetical protein